MATKPKTAPPAARRPVASSDQRPDVPLPTLRRRLLAWYDRHKRDMPWRGARDPYHVWLSESMLQQTQVATVIPYYHRFIERFPSVRDLAAAPLDDVLRLWSGLGYYARARNLHRAAQTIVSDHGGRFPDSVDGLLTLPGVGRYTAGAVASIAFDQRAPVVDGNVVRVLTRVFNLDDDVAGKAGQDRLWGLAESLLPTRRCGDFNQALMELGAAPVCSPGGQAQCLLCPLRDACGARAAGTVGERPVKTRKTRVREETHVIIAIESEGRRLFVRRPEGGLWGGLWELPTAVCNGDAPLIAARRLASRWAGAPCRVGRAPFCDLRHLLTHRTVRFLGFRCKAKHLNAAERKVSPATTGKILRAAQDETHSAQDDPRHSHDHAPSQSAQRQWLSLDAAEELGLSSAMRKVLAALRAT